MLARLVRALIVLGLLGGGFVALGGRAGAADGWARGTPTIHPHAAPKAVILPDGRVLVAGGYGILGPPAPVVLVEIYDPATDRWTPTAPREQRYFESLTLLPDGQVLLAGGLSATDTVVATAERYDPRTDTWSPAAPMSAPRAGHSAILLADGRVLVVGGDEQGGTAEIYDPAANRWTPAGRLTGPRQGHSAIRLPDGRVLIVGGQAFVGNALRPLATVERYDPAAGRWSTVAPMPWARSSASATLLPDGQVLVAGGIGAFPPGKLPGPGEVPMLASAELYDPVVDRWSPAGDMSTARSEPALTTLNDGRTLAIGGGLPGEDGWAQNVDVYTAVGAARQCFPQTGKCVQGRFLAYWQAHGGLAIDGYPISDEFTQTLEDGKPYTVQYFERVRMEYHPENQPPYDVLLGQFGRRILAAVPDAPTAAVTSKDGYTFFPQTGHNVDPWFLAYWQANGGLAQFGYPLTEAFQQQLEDGKTYEVQYFERARFELHPENAPPYDLELGQFGRRILDTR